MTAPIPAPGSSPASAISSREINRASVELSNWYMAGQSSREGHSDIMLHRAGSTFQAYGADLVAIHGNFKQLDEYERETIDDLRDQGASIPDLVDYLRAPVDINPEGKEIRSDVASRLRLRQFKAQSRQIQSSGRYAAVLAGSALILTAGAVLAAPTVVPFISPKVAPAISVALTPLVPYLPMVSKAAFGLLSAAAGGGAVTFLGKTLGNWQKIKGGPPRLDVGKHEDFSDLPNSLGNIDYQAITDEYQAIPSADRYLLAHLSPSEMRLFLSGSDSVRKHIITSSPPSSWAKIQSKFDNLAHGKKTIPSRAKRLSQVIHTLITATWNREKASGRIPDLERRMETWRAAAEINRRSRQEDLGLPVDPTQQSDDVVLTLGPDRKPIGSIPRTKLRSGAFLIDGGLCPSTNGPTPKNPL